MTIKKVPTEGPPGVSSPETRSISNRDEVKEHISLAPEASIAGVSDDVKTPVATNIQIDSESSDNGSAAIQSTEASDGNSSDEKHMESTVEDGVTTDEVMNINGDKMALVSDDQETDEGEESLDTPARDFLDMAEGKQGETGVKEGEEAGVEEKAKDAGKGEGEVEEEETEEPEAETQETEEVVEAAKSVIGEDEDWAKSLLDDQDPDAVLDDSPARLEWLTQKRELNEKNEHLDRMMAMVGHEEVKAHFLTVKTKVEVAKRWGEDMKDLDLDLTLHGHSGTGMFSQ